VAKIHIASYSVIASAPREENLSTSLSIACRPDQLFTINSKPPTENA
jgi:hypothetical protein